MELKSIKYFQFGGGNWYRARISGFSVPRIDHLCYTPKIGSEVSLILTSPVTFQPPSFHQMSLRTLPNLSCCLNTNSDILSSRTLGELLMQLRTLPSPRCHDHHFDGYCRPMIIQSGRQQRRERDSNPRSRKPRSSV